MKKILFLLFILPATIYAQDTAKHQTDADGDNQVYVIVQQTPRFNGNLNDYLSDHLNYPEKAMDKGLQGTVYVTFIVEKDGSLSGVKILRGVEHSLDSSAVACISSMPKWIPGVQNNKPARVSYSIPIRFTTPVIEPNSVNPSTPPRIK